MHAQSAARASIACLLSIIAACDREVETPPVPPAPEISVVEVVQRDQPIYIELVGETNGSSHIPIRARVEGILVGMHFSEGRKVEAGDLLYTIDPIPYESKVTEAEGYRAEARTQLAKSKADLERIEPLAAMGAASEADLDGAQAQYEAALGAVQVANAKVEQANIQLGYTNIHAPIGGRIGITLADVGEFVGRSPNPVVLNYLSLIDPIRVRFAIDERTYLRFGRKHRDMSAEERAEREKRQDEDTFELILADGSVHPYRGRSVAYDAAIDPKTGTFTLEADFPNPSGLVLAGQFARVKVQINELAGALLIPQRAISELQGLYQIFVIDDEGGVHLRGVELGPRIGRLQVVTKGLAPGERVAVETARLRAGMTVRPLLRQLDDDGALIERAVSTPESTTPDAAAAD